MNLVILASDTVYLGAGGNSEFPIDLKPDTSDSDFDDGDGTSSYYNYKA